jgi:hypothetical protein
MHLYDTCHNNRSDLPIATVKPRIVAQREVTRKLEAIGDLELSAQDRGFLRLAQLLLQPESCPQSRPAAGWGKGLVS